jgi:GNAT superfamily N-acetyltransferase
MIRVAPGYTRSGVSEPKQMWVDGAYRGRGYVRALFNAFIAEAYSRGVRRIWAASYDFQAPECMKNELRSMRVTPHVAQNTIGRSLGDRWPHYAARRLYRSTSDALKEDRFAGIAMLRT